MSGDHWEDSKTARWGGAVDLSLQNNINMTNISQHKQKVRSQQYQALFTLKLSSEYHKLQLVLFLCRLFIMKSTAHTIQEIPAAAILTFKDVFSLATKSAQPWRLWLNFLLCFWILTFLKQQISSFSCKINILHMHVLICKMPYPGSVCPTAW